MIECLVFSDFTGGNGVTGDGGQISDDVLRAHAEAIQEQLCGPFADAWDGAKVVCRVGAPLGADVGPNERLVAYWQHPDQANAAGYHTVSPDGRPYAKVFLDDAVTLSTGPQSASSIASHECLEITIDPFANYLALRADGLFDALEVADAVEDTTYAASNGVEVSNFLTPAAFNPGAPGPYDHLGVLVNQYDMTPGGYRITGSASLGADRQMRVTFKATGPGLEDLAKRARKSRVHSRISLRRASMPALAKTE